MFGFFLQICLHSYADTGNSVDSISVVAGQIHRGIGDLNKTSVFVCLQLCRQFLNCMFTYCIQSDRLRCLTNHF